MDYGHLPPMPRDDAFAGPPAGSRTAEVAGPGGSGARSPHVGPGQRRIGARQNDRRSGEATHYDRARDLPALLPIWPDELKELTAEGHHRLIQRLRRTLREERRRGLAGSWTYDLARHARLYRALQAEVALLPKPLSSWAARSFGRQEPRDGLNPDACRDPSSSRAGSGQRHNSARPSDSRAEAATSSDIPRATSCSGSASGASGT